MRVMPVSIAAIFALSHRGVRSRLSGSTNWNFRPCAVSKAYQNRSPAAFQWGTTLVSNTSLATFPDIQREASS